MAAFETAEPSGSAQLFNDPIPFGALSMHHFGDHVVSPGRGLKNAEEIYWNLPQLGVFLM